MVLKVSGGVNMDRSLLRPFGVRLVSIATLLALMVAMVASPARASGTPTGSITGTVSDSRGTGLRLPLQIWVNVLDDAGNSVTLVQLNGDGSYQVSGLAPGGYRIQIQDWSHSYLYEYYGESETLDSATTVTVDDGQPTENINVSLDPAIVASGQFVGPGGEAIDSSSWIMVSAYDEFGAYAGEGQSSGSDASFEVGEIPSGKYRLAYFDVSCAYEPEYSGKSSTFSGSELISVERGTILDLGEIELSRGTGACPPLHGPLAAPRAMATGSELSVSWDRVTPLPGEEEVTGYVVESLPAGAQCSTSGATSCVVSRATPGVDYRFFVSATNGGGSSTPSPPSNSIRLAIPEPTPEPQRVYEAKIQQVKKWPKRVRVGQKKALRARTDAGIKVRWKSKNPRFCSVDKGKLKGLRPGKCRLKAVAKSKRGYVRYKAVKTVRVR
jgi:hypothetical protein